MTRIAGFGEAELAKHQAKVRAGVPPLYPQPRPGETVVVGKPKRNKYNARKVYLDRTWFASKAEARRYELLRKWERTGIVTGLVVHPAFPLEVDGKQIGTYRADFRYIQDGQEIVEDVKSPATAKKETFMRTKKHVLAQYGIEISVVMR